MAIVAIVISFAPSLGLLPTVAPVATGTPAATATPDACSPANMQTAALDFNSLAREFDDSAIIAQNTPREQLAGPIADLQRVRRASEDYQVPECLVTLQNLQLAYMNTYLDAIVALFATNQNPDATAVVDGQRVLLQHALTEQDSAVINQNIVAAMQYRESYLDEMAKILGITRVPSPTPILETETPSATP